MPSVLFARPIERRLGALEEDVSRVSSRWRISMVRPATTTSATACVTVTSSRRMRIAAVPPDGGEVAEHPDRAGDGDRVGDRPALASLQGSA